VICQEEVELYDRADHLMVKHPAPVGGFKFWFHGEAYYTDHPSMLVLEILRVVNCSAAYQFWEERLDGDIPLSHANAVDLRREPRFYAVPPATF